MSELIVNTFEDLRTGRTSWRVLLLLVIPAFAAGFSAGLFQF